MGIGVDEGETGVSPTHVGMDRGRNRDRRTVRSEPHARGDGPYGPMPGGDPGVVSPTHVGMDRSASS